MGFEPKNKVKVGNGLTAVSAVVLVVLIFFILMTVVSKKDDQTSASPAPDNDFNPSVTVVITKDNQYYLLPGETEKDKRSFDNIKDQIVTKVMATDNKQLKIEGHRLASYETIYNPAGLAQKNNWQYRLDYTRETEETPQQ
jgi:biopolymer transport protein ExbD